MVRHKVLATIIITAIVLLLPKPANALTVVPGQHSGAYLNPLLNISYVQGGQTKFKYWSQVQGLPTLGNDYNNGVKVIDFGYGNDNNIQIPGKSYATVDLQIKTNVFQYFRVLTFNTSVPDVAVVDFDVNYANGFGEQQIVGNTTYNWNTVLITVSLYNSSDDPRQLSLSGGNQIMFTATNTFTTNSDWYFWCSSVNFYSANDAENEVAEKELEGQDNIEGQDTSGSNQGVSDDNYSSLLDIFSGFITAITNVSGGTCTISLNTDFANLGNVDLCTYDPPSYVQIIGSIILILLFVPLSMALIKRILKTIQELQQ